MGLNEDSELDNQSHHSDVLPQRNTPGDFALQSTAEGQDRDPSPQGAAATMQEEQKIKAGSVRSFINATDATANPEYPQVSISGIDSRFTEIFQSFSSRADGVAGTPTAPSFTPPVPSDELSDQPAAKNSFIGKPSPFPEPASEALSEHANFFTSQSKMTQSDPDGFTELLRIFSAAQEERGVLPLNSVDTLPALAASSESGNVQGEFTRIISSSLLREAAAQQTHLVENGQQQNPTSDSVRFESPATPAPTVSPVARPIIPESSAVAGGRHILSAAPPAPQPTDLPSQNPFEVRIQRYLYLLLAFNVVLMLMVLLLLVAVLRRH